MYVQWTIVTGIGLPALVCAQPGPDRAIVEQIEAQFKKRRESPATVRYEIEGTISYPAGGLTARKDPAAAPAIRENFPIVDTTFPHKAIYLIDSTRPRVRKDETTTLLNVSDAVFVPRRQTQSFDGQTSYHYYPKGQDAVPNPAYLAGDQVTQRKGYSLGLLLVEDCPVLFGHGFVGKSNPPVQFGSPDTLFKATDWSQVSTGDIDGRECVVLRSNTKTNRYEELWVDVGRSCAIRRWRLVQADRTLAQHEIQYRLTSGHWLPSRWQFDDLQGRGRVTTRASRQCVVVAVRVDAPVTDPDFNLKLPPATLVIDPDTSAESIVDETGRLVPRAEYGRSRSRWPWLLGLILLVSLAVYFWHRTRRNRVTA